MPLGAKTLVPSSCSASYGPYIWPGRGPYCEKTERPSQLDRTAVRLERSPRSHNARRNSGLSIDSPSARARSMVLRSRSLSPGSVPASGR